MYKVLDVCRYVIEYSNEKDYSISNLKLQKLLYFIQACFVLNKKDHSACFEERIEAWDFGPVVPVAYHAYKHYGGSEIITAEPAREKGARLLWRRGADTHKENEIAADDKVIINAVIDKFRDSTATDLVNITHRQTPWMEAYEKKMNKEITIDAIREYFHGERSK